VTGDAYERDVVSADGPTVRLDIRAQRIMGSRSLNPTLILRSRADTAVALVLHTGAYR
jgi:hypothetical protein